jgi:hypothetical protein
MTTNNPSVRKLNEYDLTGEYGVGYINSAKGRFSFKFDLDDYDIISKYTWHISRVQSGYIRTIIRISKHTCRQITMHRLVTGLDGLNMPEICVDHINHDTHDNRKSNLRICSPEENSLNKEKCAPEYGSGVTLQDGKWLVRFRRGNKYYYGGMFNDYDEAIQKRLRMEPRSSFSYMNGVMTQVGA